MLKVNGSNNQPFVKAVDALLMVCKETAQVQSQVQQRMTLTSKHLFSHKLVLRQMSKETNKILWGGIVLFILPMSSPTQLARIWKPPPVHTEAWGCQSLLMGHNWLKSSNLRDSCHILESVTNHQTPPKCPQTNFWSLPSEDCAWSTVLHQTMLNSLLGMIPGCSHIAWVYINTMNFSYLFFLFHLLDSYSWNIM